ncbi:DUF4251 domain-containing protein [Proteiniphilum acetatigenes]|uniref:DUF4251 domain-containing protein n=1 Tax=Proteiniphilum acetatigenes TaxID=294710 RepID=UPI0003A67F9E|nr:DUF4251 domain-containing protein [Proteiniphilum acetatigenes]SFL41632.1 protein of unknown function [Porphyromonadaceae bacterium KH3CP3RA]
MKKLPLFGFAVLLLVWIFYACGSAQTAVEKEKQAADVRNAVEVPDFTFKATYAYPTGYKSVYLSPYYDVKVSPDTVVAYLPYYGRAYRAPMDPREGGYRFTSTDFEYRADKGNERGNWNVEITLHDLGRPVTFRFDIWENGTARLSVNDVDRQQISFQGDLVLRKEE